MHELTEARGERRLLGLQDQPAAYKLLTIDELCYVPLSPAGAEELRKPHPSKRVMVSRSLANGHAYAIKGLLRAINRALKETIENPDAAIDVLASEEPLIGKDIEKRRLLLVYNNLIETRETRELGLGDVSESRLMPAASTIAASFELVRSPGPGELFNRSFLPAKGDRALPRHPGHE